MNLQRQLCIILVASLTGPVPSVSGQDNATEPATDPDPLQLYPDPPIAPKFRLRLGGLRMFETDVDGGGDVSVSGFGMRLDSRLPVHEGAVVDFSFGYEYDSYDFSGSGSLTGLDPWDDVHSLRFRAILNWKLQENIWLFGGPVVAMSAEDGADYSNAFTAGAQVGVRWRTGENFTIGVGLSAISQIDDDPWVLPLVFFNWEFQENWTLRAGAFDIGSQGGPGLELAWRFAPRWEASVGANFERRRFRLDKGVVAPNGVGQYEVFGMYGRVEWVFNEQTRLGLSAGVAVAGELRLENDDGKKIVEEDFDPAPFIGLRLTLRF